MQSLSRELPRARLGDRRRALVVVLSALSLLACDRGAQRLDEDGRRGAAAQRAACAFGPGAMPSQTVGRPYPIGREIPVRHWFLLMQENRSFDHYFGTMPGVDGIPGGVATNPDASGAAIEAFHQTAYCTDDTGHGWDDGHVQWNGGANDGFVIDNEPDGRRAMGWYDGSDLPFYWDLYRRFAMSDHHHSSVLGPTWINRQYYLSGTSFGLTENHAVPRERVPPRDHVIFQQLDRIGVEWRIYYDGVPFEYGAFPHYSLLRTHRHRPYAQLAAELASGDVAPVTYLEPTWNFQEGVDAADEHPHADVQVGQRWVREVITAIMQSPVWRDSAIVLTYDEWGGFYDHVPPPEACPPGDYPPDLEERSQAGGFDRLGFRVPLVIVSPWSRPGYVSERVTDLSSVLRLLQTAYDLPALTARDANAWPLLDMFDFEHATFETPPELEEALVDAARLEACHAAFPDD